MNYSIDSRSVNIPEQTIFFALKGPHHDGHDYISNLYSKGVRHFVVSEQRPEFKDLKGASFRYVNNTFEELQRLAAEHRQEVAAEIVGITGSNGKTVVKEWIAQLIRQDIPLYRSPRSYNSQVGVPLSVLAIPETSALALIEAGISQKGEMSRLEKIIRPDVGIFTHLGDAHSENFQNGAALLEEKSSLFAGCRVLISQEGPVADHLVRRYPEKKMIFWGVSEASAVRVAGSAVDNGIRKVMLNTSLGKTRSAEIEIPFADEASFEDCMTAVTFLLYKGYDLQEIAERVKTLQPVAMRMEIKEGVNDCILIKDYYNSDMASFSLAVNSLAMQDATKDKVVILSDFVDVSTAADVLYREAADLMRKAGVVLFIGIGKQLAAARNCFSGIESRFYPDTDAFLAEEHRTGFNNQVILIKGARRFRLEYIGSFLQRQSHTTVLEVDLDALAFNLNRYRNRIPAGTKMAVMVKAFSYGSGSGEVASALQYNGVDYLMVAYADEGVDLRRKGITMPIGVMNPEPEAFDDIIDFELEPEIYSVDLLKAFDQALARHGAEGYPVHLKLNTGMNRSGLDRKDIPRMLAFMENCRTMVIRSMFSHLAVSDDGQEDDFTLGQFSLFNEMVSMVQPHFPYKIIRHILNSAGIERFPQYAFEMVRLGIGLYGIGSDPALKPISTFKTHIASIREITPEQTVGYGRKGRVEKPSRVAVIPVGYADGLNRHLSCGTGEMFVRGKRVKILGNICMDACMLDITDTDAVVGDEVEIFGHHIPVTELAGKLNTIPYEILTGISRRVKRVYYRE